MPTIELNREEYKHLRQETQTGHFDWSSQEEPMQEGDLCLERTFVTNDGKRIMVQARVLVTEVRIAEWVPDEVGPGGHWLVGGVELPEENPPGMALHKDEHGPGGYKTL